MSALQYWLNAVYPPSNTSTAIRFAIFVIAANGRVFVFHFVFPFYTFPWWQYLHIVCSMNAFQHRIKSETETHFPSEFRIFSFEILFLLLFFCIRMAWKMPNFVGCFFFLLLLFFVYFLLVVSLHWGSKCIQISMCVLTRIKIKVVFRRSVQSACYVCRQSSNQNQCIEWKIVRWWSIGRMVTKIKESHMWHIKKYLHSYFNRDSSHSVVVMMVLVARAAAAAAVIIGMNNEMKWKYGASTSNHII